MLGWLKGKKEDAKKPASGVAVKESPPPAAKGAKKKDEAQAGPRQIRTRCFLPTKPENESEKALGGAVIRNIAQCEQLLAAPDFDLPMLPSVSMKLMGLLNNPDVSLSEISATVQHDPVLTAKFFKLANSALYAGKRKIENIGHALSWLGVAKVKGLVMSISLHGSIFRNEDLKDAATTLWKHSMATAVTAETLARETEANPDACFMAGLLHDIGKLPAIMLIQKAIKGDVGAIRPEYYTSMLEQFHIRAGKALLEHWTLPEEAQMAILTHFAVNTLDDAEKQVKEWNTGREDLNEEYVKLLATVVLADRTASALGYGDEPGDLDLVGAPLALQMGFMDTRAETILEALPSKIEQLASAL